MYFFILYRIVRDEFSSSSRFYHSFPHFVFFLQRRSGLYIAFSMGLFLVGFHGIFFDRRYCVSGAGVLVSRETRKPPSGSGFMFFQFSNVLSIFGYVGDSVVVVRETTGGVFKGFVYRVGDFIKPYSLQICFLDSSMRFYCFT